jgi:hypothetical protein
MYKFIQAFPPFDLGETVEATDVRFGSEIAEHNQPHIDHLIEANIIEDNKEDSKPIESKSKETK